MLSSDQYKAEDNLSVLIVGPPLMGKTNVAMGFPDPYFISTDEKLGNAVQRHPGKKFWFDYVNKETETGKAVPEDKRWARLTELVLNAHKHTESKTLVVDNLSDVSNSLIAHILPHSKLFVGGERVMDKALWGPYFTSMHRLIIAAKAQGKILVMVCHETVDADEVTGILTYRPSVSGQMRDKIASYFTDVWRCEVEPQVGKPEPRYVVRTVPTPRMALGNSLGLPPTMAFSWEEVAKRLKRAA